MVLKHHLKPANLQKSPVHLIQIVMAATELDILRKESLRRPVNGREHLERHSLLTLGELAHFGPTHWLHQVMVTAIAAVPARKVTPGRGPVHLARPGG